MSLFIIVTAIQCIGSSVKVGDEVMGRLGKVGIMNILEYDRAGRIQIKSFLFFKHIHLCDNEIWPVLVDCCKLRGWLG